MPDQVQLNTSEKATLIAALKCALLVAAKARSVECGLFFQVLALRDAPDSALRELRELLNVIKAIPALEFFDHASQCALGNWEDVNFCFLVQWLISRGQQVGAEQTVNDLARYLKSETIEVTAILAIDGFSVERNIELGEYEVVAWNDVAMTDTKWHVEARGLFGGERPTAAVVQRHKIKRVHVRPWDTPGPYVPLSIEPALDLLRCVTAIAGAGFRLLYYWFEPPEWTPWTVNLSTFLVDSRTISRPVKLDEVVVPLLLESASRLRKLDESNRLRLRVPLDRLNRSYLAGMRSVDKAIELGIALESLYAPAKLSEAIVFAVRTRAARFLGSSPDERRKISETLQDVYDLRSHAVHSGRFDAVGASKKWRDKALVRQVLEEGQRVVSQSLIKVIREGEPNWKEFDIGNAEPTSATVDTVQPGSPADQQQAADC